MLFLGDRAGRGVHGFRGRLLQQPDGAPALSLENVGILSGSSADSRQDEPIFADASKMKKLRFPFVGRGKLEGEERTGELVALLRKHAVPHVEDNTGGQAHDWVTWRYLMDKSFLPALFAR